MVNGVSNCHPAAWQQIVVMVVTAVLELGRVCVLVGSVSECDTLVLEASTMVTVERK